MTDIDKKVYALYCFGTCSLQSAARVVPRGATMVAFGVLFVLMFVAVGLATVGFNLYGTVGGVIGGVLGLVLCIVILAFVAWRNIRPARTHPRGTR